MGVDSYIDVVYFASMETETVVLIGCGVSVLIAGVVVGIALSYWLSRGSRELLIALREKDVASSGLIAELRRALVLKDQELGGWKMLATAMQDQMGDQPTAVDIIEAVKSLMIPDVREPAVEPPASFDPDDEDWSDQLLADAEINARINQAVPPPPAEFMGGPVIVDDDLTGEGLEV